MSPFFYIQFIWVYFLKQFMFCKCWMNYSDFILQCFFTCLTLPFARSPSRQRNINTRSVCISAWHMEVIRSPFPDFKHSWNTNPERIDFIHKFIHSRSKIFVAFHTNSSVFSETRKLGCEYLKSRNLLPPATNLVVLLKGTSSVNQMFSHRTSSFTILQRVTHSSPCIRVWDLQMAPGRSPGATVDGDSAAPRPPWGPVPCPSVCDKASSVF